MYFSAIYITDFEKRRIVDNVFVFYTCGPSSNFIIQTILLANVNVLRYVCYML